LKETAPKEKGDRQYARDKEGGENFEKKSQFGGERLGGRSWGRGRRDRRGGEQFFEAGTRVADDTLLNADRRLRSMKKEKMEGAEKGRASGTQVPDRNGRRFKTESPAARYGEITKKGNGEKRRRGRHSRGRRI